MYSVHAMEGGAAYVLYCCTTVYNFRGAARLYIRHMRYLLPQPFFCWCFLSKKMITREETPWNRSFTEGTPSVTKGRDVESVGYSCSGGGTQDLETALHVYTSRCLACGWAGGSCSKRGSRIFPFGARALCVRTRQPVRGHWVSSSSFCPARPEVVTPGPIYHRHVSSVDALKSHHSSYCIYTCTYSCPVTCLKLVPWRAKDSSRSHACACLCMAMERVSDDDAAVPNKRQ